MLYVKLPMFSKYIFNKAPGNKGDLYSFSSDLEKIGIEFDVEIQNGTYIDVLSEPIEINREKYGTISVVKIRADIARDYHTIIKEFWVPESCITKVETNETSSSTIAN